MANNEIKNISQKERVLLEKPGIRIAKLRKNKKIELLKDDKRALLALLRFLYTFI